MSVDATIMKNDNLQLKPASSLPARCIAIASTFTVEPVEDPLALWMDELGLPASIKFAPYNQVFQQLLDPASLLATNRHGINIITVRIEDWQRFHRMADNRKDLEACLIQNATDLDRLCVLGILLTWNHQKFSLANSNTSTEPQSSLASQV
jgi:hypothetical protein